MNVAGKGIMEKVPNEFCIGKFTRYAIQFLLVMYYSSEYFSIVDHCWVVLIHVFEVPNGTYTFICKEMLGKFVGEKYCTCHCILIFCNVLYIVYSFEQEHMLQCLSLNTIIGILRTCIFNVC